MGETNSRDRDGGRDQDGEVEVGRIDDPGYERWRPKRGGLEMGKIVNIDEINVEQ
jgi:hypothetical protein